MARVALVTGGTEGIGAATCEALAHAGYITIATYGHNDARAEEFFRRSHIPTRKWDVGDYAACLAGVADVEGTFGDIDILINNAGITSDCALHKMEPDVWRRVIGTNLTGCFNMCRAVINGMRTRHYGRIVMVGSVNGQSGQFGQTNYAASKSGVVGFAKSLALESAARGITVNVVAPGYTDTAMVAKVPPVILDKVIEGIPVGRLAKSEEIARAILFLVSEESGYITGATLSVNGGKYLI